MTAKTHFMYLLLAVFVFPTHLEPLVSPEPWISFPSLRTKVPVDAWPADGLGVMILRKAILEASSFWCSRALWLSDSASLGRIRFFASSNDFPRCSGVNRLMSLNKVRSCDKTFADPIMGADSPACAWGL